MGGAAEAFLAAVARGKLGYLSRLGQDHRDDDELRARIAERFGERFERVRLLLPYEEGGRLNELYALGAPIDEREDTPEGVLVVARLPRRELRRYAPYLIAEEAPRRRRKGA